MNVGAGFSRPVGVTEHIFRRAEARRYNHYIYRNPLISTTFDVTLPRDTIRSLPSADQSK